MKYRYSAIFSTLLLLQPLYSIAAEDHVVTIDDMVLVAQNEILPSSTFSLESDMGPGSTETTGSLDDDLFGTPGGGYVHPFLTIAGEYTDNLFNVDEDEKSNFLTSITPGIWFALPRTKEVPITINPNNTSAGGLQMALPRTEGFDRINAYLLGSMDFQSYSEDSDLNDHDDRVEGLFQVNLRGGLSARIVDRYTRDRDRFDVGNSTEDSVRRYYSNIALADIDWDFSEKFATKVEVSNFNLDYKADIDDFLDRTDNTFSLYGFYKYSPKTSLYLQYRYTDVDYDSTELRNNRQNYIYGGFNWESTAKTSFRLKAGYQNRRVENNIINETLNTQDDFDDDSFSFELNWLYQITEKTGISLAVNHKLEETDSFVAIDKKVLAGIFQYHQRLTEKLHGTLALSYENADYTQLIEQDRDDDRFLVRPALQYVFRDWLMAELSYSYDTRSSSDDIFDYDTNTVSLSLNSAL